MTCRPHTPSPAHVLRPEGVAPAELRDDDLARELEHLHATRHETFLHGSESALDHHTHRMLELEREYLRRFPAAATPDPLRTRAGARQAAGVA